MENQTAEKFIDFISCDQETILENLKKYNIALSLEEGKKIQQEFLGRTPSVAECIMWSIQGSEHCSYKSSRLFLKQFITNGPNVILGPGEDAGIVEIAQDDFGKKYGIVISHESHNHPSQVVPYEGAATGVGGNVRDVACMGARVIAGADALRFGEIEKNKTKQISSGVVSGIAGYGNPIGVPIIAGDVYFNKGYNNNCLVNVVHLGVIAEDEIIHSRAPENSNGFDLILVGKATDNTGFGGAQFASLELNETKKELNKGAVQEPNAFLKRHLLKATYALVKKLKEKNFLQKVGFKDLGAGGICCAAVELADNANLGAEIFLENVLCSMDNLLPEVVLCSETQERFMWVSPPEVSDLILEHYNKIFELPKMAGNAAAVKIGKIKDHGRFIVSKNGKEIINARASDVTKGLIYERNYIAPKDNFIEPVFSEPQNYNDIFLKILAHENIASRKPIFERYDKQVQGATVVEPGEADAGVLKPFLDEEYPKEIRKTGIALSVDQNPRFSELSPYWGAVNAVLESMRNVSAVGAIPYAITNCLNYGNPEKEDQMWQFVEGARGVADAAKSIHLKDNINFSVPIVSGNVSFYNESNGEAIPPSAIIACLGKMKDAQKAITMHFKKTNSKILLVGDRKDECGGSVYYEILGALGASVPKPNFKETENQIFALTQSIDMGLILAAHDISDGGVAIAISEMCFKNKIGCEVFIPGELRNDKKLFGETGGFVLEVEKENVQKVKEVFINYNVEILEIGETIFQDLIKINNLNTGLEQAKEIWENGLRYKL